MRAVLTHATIRALEAKPHRYSFGDRNTEGLRLHVHPTGRKSFILDYRDTEGRQRSKKLGEFPRVSLATAREEASQALAAIELGRDLFEERRQQRRQAENAPSLVELAYEYILDRERRGRSPKTLSEYRRTVSTYLANSGVGESPARVVTPAELELLLEELMDRGPYQANRVYEFVRAVYRWSIKKGRRDGTSGYPSQNPCDALDRPFDNEQARDRTLSDAELRIFW